MSHRTTPETARALSRVNIDGRARIIGEIPDSAHAYFVSALCLHRLDPRRRRFYDDGAYIAPKFDSLDEAKVWCAENGLRYIVVPWGGEA